MVVLEERAADVRGRAIRHRQAEVKTVEPESIRGRVLSPPSVDPRVAVLGVADTGMVQVAHVAADLVEASGGGADAEQRTPGLV